jgi:hypothetical protein
MHAAGPPFVIALRIAWRSGSINESADTENDNSTSKPLFIKKRQCEQKKTFGKKNGEALEALIQ